MVSSKTHGHTVPGPITATGPTGIYLPILVGTARPNFSVDLIGLYRERFAAFDEVSYFELRRGFSRSATGCGTAA
jgi:hypothetical protein